MTVDGRVVTVPRTTVVVVPFAAWVLPLEHPAGTTAATKSATNTKGNADGRRRPAKFSTPARYGTRDTAPRQPGVRRPEMNSGRIRTQ
ncbi:MAG: hypothetical protein JWL83_2553 [Actinomycetia bacterium]|nr:hypothetical protein [Actinomycetes bacterium]